FFADWGVWSSDAYHHDGSDSWSAIREMQAAAVPEDVQGKLLGGNARRMYGVESRLFVTDEPPPARASGLVPGRRGARRVGAGGGRPAGARHHELRALEARPPAAHAGAAPVLAEGSGHDGRRRRQPRLRAHRDLGRLPRP